MRWLDKIRNGATALLRRRTVEAQLDAELQFHFERQIAQNVAAGMSESEARRAATLEFGGVEQLKEECRDMRKSKYFEDLLFDIRYGWRALAKSPGFAAVALVTIALGIGANTAIFSAVDAVLLKPLPIREPQNVVALRCTESAPGAFPLTGPDYTEWRKDNTTFEDMSLFSWPNNANVGKGENAAGAFIERTQSNYFSLLGVRPHLGRTFAAGEDQKGGARVVVLTDEFWKKQFGARKDVIGQTLSINSEAYTVIGVMPSWYRERFPVDVWVPVDMNAERMGHRGEHSWRAVGRLKHGVSLTQARTDLQRIADALAKQFPGNNKDVNPIVMPMHEELVGDFGSQLWVLFGAVGLVLLIACANVANLVLARATGRRREVSVRSALGAGRGRLVRQMLTESLLLSLLGGSLGVLLAFAGVTGLRAALPAGTPEPNPIIVGSIPLLFTLVVSVVVGALFGLAPALQSSAVQSGDALKSKGAINAMSRRGTWLRSALVISEIALSLALLIGAGLLLRTFANLRATKVGVRPEGVLTASVRLPDKQYKGFEEGRVFYQRLLQTLEATPGVQAAAVSTSLPLRGGNNGYIMIPGQEEHSMTGPLVQQTSIGGDYFRAFGIPLIAGRTFEGEDHELMTRVIRDYLAAKGDAEVKAVTQKYEVPTIVNETMVRTFWPKQDAIGKRFSNFATFRVIGIVGDTKQQELKSAPMPEAYYPLEWELTQPEQVFSLVAYTQGRDGSALTGTLRAAIQNQDQTLALMNVKTMDEIIADSLRDTRSQTWLLTGMALLALILAAVGTYGVMSYVVGERTNEIGIRIALGAGRGSILVMVLRQAGILIAVGVVIGMLGATGAARLMQGLLVGVKPVDPATYAAVGVTLAAVALTACYLPVWRAMRVDPVVALRDE